MTIYGLTAPKADVDSTPSSDWNAYLRILRVIEQCVIDIDKPATDALIHGLAALRTEIRQNEQAATSDDDALSTLLKTHRDVTISRHEQTEADIRELLEVVGTAVDTVGSQADQQHSALRGIAEQFHTTSRLHDIGEMRRAITRLVTEFRRLVEDTWRANQTSVSKIQAQLEHFQSRLETAEKLAATDPLTGLLNRREAEARMEEKIARNAGFSLMILDLDRFKQINDQNGHTAGDQVLKIFARKLSKICKPGDLACRWGGDEFVLIMECDGAAGNVRCSEIVNEVNGSYTILLMGRPVEVTVKVSIGMAEYQPGERVEEVFARADDALYQKKSRPMGIAPAVPQNAPALS